MVEEIKNAVLDDRLFKLVAGALFALGGWWLQNQYEATLRTQEQISQIIEHVDKQYVDKEMLQQHMKEHDRRLDDVYREIDRLEERNYPNYGKRISP